MNFGVTPKKQQELESRMQACGLSESDIRETFVRASGPGGQHVNKTSTAVVLKHIPTGLETKCGRTRSQLLNRFYARRQMCELLEAKQQGISPFRSGTQERIRKQKDRRRRRQEKNSAAQ